MHRSSVVLPLTVALIAACHWVIRPAAADPPSQVAGLTLKALSDAELDTIKQKTGHRVGVLVTAVAPGSPAAAAGLRPGDLLFIVAEKPVDSPAAVDNALAEKTGPVAIAGIRQKADGTGEIVQLTLTMPEGTTAPPQPPADPEGKLKALDAALAAGVITQEEYNRKKAELLAQAKPPALDKETQGKLKALDAAREAGVLSEAEYQQKRAALLKGAGTTSAGPGNGLSSYADPQGRFTIQYPAGWQAKPRDDENGVDLVKGHATGSVIAFKGQGTPDELLNAFAGPVRQQTKEFKEVRRGQVPIGTGTGPMLEYTGVNPNGVSCHAILAASVGQEIGFLFMLVALADEFGGVRTEWEAVLKSFGGEHAAATAPVPGGASTAAADAGGDAFTAYFNMLDFIRSQAWGRQIATPAEERQKLLALLDQAGPETRQNVTQALQGVPQVWLEIQSKWKGATEEKRTQQREYWRTQLLLPSFLFPPPVETDTFKGRNDRVVLEYPRGWVVSQTEDGDNQYLYLGPKGTQTSWDQLIDPASSPPGALFAIMPIPDELKNVKTFVQGARLLAQQYVLTPGAALKEINAVDLEGGAIITFRGRYPGQKEERFYWVGAVRYGPDYILAGRLGGPTAQADTLVPAFSHMVATMELNPPSGGGGDYGGAMVDYYTSRAGNIAVSSGWQ